MWRLLITSKVSYMIQRQRHLLIRLAFGDTESFPTESIESSSKRGKGILPASLHIMHANPGIFLSRPNPACAVMRDQSYQVTVTLVYAGLKVRSQAVYRSEQISPI